MMSFLFPEDLNVASRPCTKQTSITTTEPAEADIDCPPMPARSPPAIPCSKIPPPPAYAPPPVPVTKERPLISVTQLDMNITHSEVDKTKSSRASRSLASLSRLKSKREAKQITKKERAITKVDVILPPLSPDVDDEFWRTGRYPTSPQSIGMARHNDHYSSRSPRTCHIQHIPSMSIDTQSAKITKDEPIVDRLQHHRSPLKIYAARDHPPFYIQRTLPGGVSKKLADFCVAHNRTAWALPSDVSILVNGIGALGPW
ncbi:hypothetical protein Q7P37_001849 [Cladosporium fusiforme]